MFSAVRGLTPRNNSRLGLGAVIALVIHAALVAAAVVLSARAVLPKASGAEVTFFSAPPPPPPPPPAGGSMAKVQPKIRPKPVVRPDTLVQPKTIPVEKPAEAEPTPEPEPEGVAGGVQGGVVGGTVGGVVGGELGGTGSTVGAKMVPSFVFDRERLSAPEPRFPQSFVDANAGRTVRATYRICVRPDGQVAEVSVLASSGMDQPIIEQIKSTWRYKPQPVPVCTQRNFIFKFQ